MTRNKIRPQTGVILLLSSVVLLIFLYWHYDLGMNRYFDVDEYAHLHWTVKLLEGKRPYIDFQTFFPPGYWLFLSLSFLSGWGTTQPLLNARFWQFLVTAGVAASSGYLFYLMRKNVFAVLAVLLFLFLPLPFDKTLEIRPDSLATLLVLLAVIFQIRYMDGRRIRDGFLTGLLYTLSLLVLPKIVPNVLAGGMVILFDEFSNTRDLKEKRITAMFRNLRFVIAGFLAPGLLFLVWAASLGDPGLVFYSLTRLPVEANKISQWFIMMPDLFFYPNGIYYGQNGWNRAVTVNQLIWLTGAVVGAVRLLTPHISGGGKRARAEFLVALQMAVQILFFVRYAPLKHAQYLIPIAVFVSWYTADLVSEIWRFLSKTDRGRWLFVVLYAVMLGIFYDVFIFGNSVKSGWTNKDTLAKLESLYRTVPVTEPILDLDGRFLFNPDTYYACCVPFGQSQAFYSRPLPSLSETLEKNRVRYINDGELKRVGTLPGPDQTYIAEHYRPHPDFPTLLVRAD